MHPFFIFLLGFLLGGGFGFFLLALLFSAREKNKWLDK